MVVSLPGLPPFRPSFYEGDNSTAMWTMLAFAQRNYPDFPSNLTDLSAFDFAYVPPNLGSAVLIPAGIMLFLSLLTVCCRLWTRYRRKSRGLGADDWLIVAAAAGASAYTIIEVVLVKYGCIGRHCYDCTYKEMVYGYKFEYVSFVVYLIAVLMTKLSILAFTWHIAPPTDKNFRTVLAGTGIFMVGSTFMIFLMVTFNCNPVPAAWDYIIRTNTQYACFSMQKIYVAWSVILAVTDLWLLLLPSHLIWRLRLPTSSKLSLTLVFSLGLFATIASFVKAQAAVRAYHTYDLTWHFVPVLIGSHLEISFGIIAASLPALNSVLGKIVPRSWASVTSWAYRHSRGRFSRKAGKSLDYSTENSNTFATEKPEITVTSTMENAYSSGANGLPVHTIDTECSAAGANFVDYPGKPPAYEPESFVSYQQKSHMTLMSQVSLDLVIQHPRDSSDEEP